MTKREVTHNFSTGEMKVEMLKDVMDYISDSPDGASTNELALYLFEDDAKNLVEKARYQAEKAVALGLCQKKDTKGSGKQGTVTKFYPLEVAISGRNQNGHSATTLKAQVRDIAD